MEWVWIPQPPSQVCLQPVLIPGKELLPDHPWRRAYADTGSRLGAIRTGKLLAPHTRSGGWVPCKRMPLSPWISCPMRPEEDQSRAKIIFKFLKPIMYKILSHQIPKLLN